MRDIVTLEAKGLKLRLILPGIILIAALFGWFSIRWQIGSMLANLTGPDDQTAVQMADTAVAWAPSDPAALSLKASTAFDTTETVAIREQAVKLAPNDYRWRVQLGRALEQDERIVRGEAELLKAVDLAPSYAYPRWHLGNFYLRQGRTEEALAELKKAAANNQTYREQVLSLAWDYFDKDPFQLENLAGDSDDGRTRLAYFFAARGRADDALRTWKQLRDGKRPVDLVIAKAIFQGLFIQRHFPQALAFSELAGFDGDAVPEVVTNGSFEKPLGESESRFGWLLSRPDPKFEAAPDSKVKHSGDRSLKVTFRGYAKPVLATIFQTVVVNPGEKYRLSFWIQTENLKTAGAPQIEIVNANDNASIAKSASFPDGTTDWQEMRIEFRVPDNCNGVTIRTIRAYCGEDCPIIGNFWYDDFQIRIAS